jgi:putative redox protein
MGSSRFCKPDILSEEVTMDAQVIWKHGMSFDGKATSGFNVPLGSDAASGGEDDGFRPLELMGVSLAGCTAMDVISILQKKQQVVTGFEVKVHADRADEHPRVFTHMVVEYVVTGKAIDPVAVNRAVELSVTKYCSAMAMLRKAVEIEQKVTIVQA